MVNNLSRRSFLGIGSGAGGFVLGSAAGAGPKTLFSYAAEPMAFPWPYRGVWAPFEHTVELAAGEHQLSLGVVDRAGSVVDGFNFSLTAS